MSFTQHQELYHLRH